MAEGVLRSSFFSNVDSVEVTGDYTVVIHLKQWDSTLPNALARQGGYMASKEAYERTRKGLASILWEPARSCLTNGSTASAFRL